MPATRTPSPPRHSSTASTWLRTSVAWTDLDSTGVVSSYKALAQVERAFRAFNTDLDIRPIRHRTEGRVRTHVFLRMLSYYLSWHVQARLAPLLFTDDDKPAAHAPRPSQVAPAARSRRALAKAATKHRPTRGSLGGNYGLARTPTAARAPSGQE